LKGHKRVDGKLPDGIASIQIRERIVLPLLTIQQYAFTTINRLNKTIVNDDLIKSMKKLLRSLFTIPVLVKLSPTAYEYDSNRD
jgi:phosphoenolpyruvate carboxylase